MKLFSLVLLLLLPFQAGAQTHYQLSAMNLETSQKILARINLLTERLGEVDTLSQVQKTRKKVLAVMARQQAQRGLSFEQCDSIVKARELKRMCQQAIIDNQLWEQARQQTVKDTIFADDANANIVPIGLGNSKKAEKPVMSEADREMLVREAEQLTEQIKVKMGWKQATMPPIETKYSMEYKVFALENVLSAMQQTERMNFEIIKQNITRINLLVARVNKTEARVDSLEAKLARAHIICTLDSATVDADYWSHKISFDPEKKK